MLNQTHTKFIIKPKMPRWLKAIFIAVTFLTLNLPVNSIAQSLPTKAEFEAVMNNAALQSNSALRGKEVDSFTKIQSIEFNARTTTMTYSYTTGVLKVTKQLALDENQRQAMKAHHVSLTCQSPFKPFLKPYALSVEHLYLDSETGRMVYKVVITDKDC